jgi:hypothetical protein
LTNTASGVGRFSRDLQRLADWLTQHDLLDVVVADQLEALRRRVQDDKVMVAFVAEFSRGKSELINALFFSGYGSTDHARQCWAHHHVPDRNWGMTPSSHPRCDCCPLKRGCNPGH